MLAATDQLSTYPPKTLLVCKICVPRKHRAGHAMSVVVIHHIRDIIRNERITGFRFLTATSLM